MDSYIVRVYRRTPTDHQPEHGVVERVAGGSKASFSSPEELWAFLAAAPRARGAQVDSTTSTRRKR